MPTQIAAPPVPRMGPSVMQSILDRMHLIVRGSVGIFATWCVRSAERRVLRELAQEPRLLNDVGLSREQALREASKLFWRA